MILNSLAACGFLLLVGADLAILGRFKAISAPLRVTGYLFAGASLALLALAPPATPPPAPVIGGMLILTAGGAGALLVWSVFLELLLARKRFSLGPRDTVRSGSYGICRHPGFWWFGILTLALGALRGIQTYAFTMFILIAANFILVFIQDRYVFPKIFTGYDDYKKGVPFLIPKKKSHRSPKN